MLISLVVVKVDLVSEMMLAVKILLFHDVMSLVITSMVQDVMRLLTLIVLLVSLSWHIIGANDFASVFLDKALFDSGLRMR